MIAQCTAWRLWVGRAIAEVRDQGTSSPAWLRNSQAQALAEASKSADGVGLLICEGISHLRHGGV
jgi:hypothetical protein